MDRILDSIDRFNAADVMHQRRDVSLKSPYDGYVAYLLYVAEPISTVRLDVA